MTRVRKTGSGLLALLCALALGFALSACGGKETVSAYGYGEEGTYYSASEDGEDMLILKAGSYILDMGTGSAGTYEWTEGEMTFYEGEEEAGYACLTEGGISLTWGGRTYAFLRYEYYTVTFTDGSSTLSTQSVLNGKAATDPGDAEKDGYVFLGWYADSDFTERYGFNTSVTSDTTVYARFVEIEGTTEYKITYDFGNGETLESETLNGKIYDLPEAEMTGYTFLGWWVSATDSADELTYRYEGETLCEDTTLFAVYVEDGGSYIGASIRDDRIVWENYNAAVTDVVLYDEDGNAVERFEIQSTRGEYEYDFASLPAGKYTLRIQGGGVDETLVYVSRALGKASGFTVVSGNILMYAAVENAERYYITIECGNPTHDHTYVDNGSSLYYDFSSCEMGADGITFTVYAYAEDYYYSVSTYNYFLGLERAEVRVEADTVLWDAVAYAMGYEVYIDGTLVATTSDTSFSLADYGTGTYEIEVKPVTSGYYSEKSDAYTFTKTTLAAPRITGIENFEITWTAVEGAVGYKVTIGDTENTVGGGNITSLALTEDSFTPGLDAYDIAVKALAADSANDSPYCEPLRVTGASVGSTVSYNDGTVTWQYSLSAAEYRITVNDGDETVVTGTNSSPVTLTKSGNNEINIYFVNDEGEIYGQASVTVYAYAIVFDARGGTAYLDGEEIDTIYVAKGDTVTLPGAEYADGVLADFLGWYTLPDTTGDPDAEDYRGDGYLFADGTVFTGSSAMVLYAAWVNPRLVIRLDPGMGTLTDGNGDYIEETYIRLNGESFTIAVPECDDKAYAFVGWYSGANGTGTRYTDGNGDAFAAFSDESVTKLYAFWAEVLSFSTTTYNGSTVLSVAAGPDISLVTEVTVPETYVLNGTERTVQFIGGTAFSSCADLKAINIPDTVIYLDVVGNGYDSGDGIFAGTGLTDVNVYATGEPSTTKEVMYYSRDGVLFRLNELNGNVELFYYPYGRTDETYEVPGTVWNDNELELSGSREVQAVRSVNAIGESVFYGHTELVYMTIPENITSIGSNTFRGCTSLTGVDFQAEVTRIEQGMFYGCTSLTEFEVPYTVKEIGESAFRGCTGLTTFTVPDNVETMEGYVFRDCTSLETVFLSANLDKVAEYTFYGCHALRGVDMSYGIGEIGQYAFYQCRSLTAVTLPDSVTSIGNYAFEYCRALEGIHLPESLTSIGNYAFGYCTLLKSIVIPDGVTTMGTNVFYCDSVLESVRLPANLTSIGNYTFYNCYSLRDVEIPSKVTSIGTYCFYNCYSLTDVVIPDSVTSIGNYCFYNCYTLTTLTVGSGVTSSSLSSSSNAFRYCYNLVEIYNRSSLTANGASGVGYLGEHALNVYTPTSGSSHMSEEDGYRFVYDGSDDYYLVGYTGDDVVLTFPETAYGNTYEIHQYAFYRNTGLYAVTLSDSVTAIGDCAFSDCYSMIYVGIGSGVKSIGTDAFANCYKLIEVYNRSSLTITAGSGGNGGVGANAKNVYTRSGGSAIISSGGFTFVSDGSGYFLVAYGGTSSDVVLPSSIEGNGYAILDYAFYENKNIKSVTMPSSVTAIGSYAFYDCTSLSSVTIGGGVTDIGRSAFYGCSLLSSVTIPDSVTYIGVSAFSGCSALAYLDLGNGVTEIAGSAFYGCTSLVDVVIPDSVVTLGNDVFEEDTALVSVKLPEGIETVPQMIFMSCSALRSIVIPDSVTLIAAQAFQGCSGLESVDFGTGVVEIGGSTFYACSSLREAVLPEGVTTVGNGAFSSCSSLERAYLPDTVTDMSTGVFGSCTSLTEAHLPSGLTTLPATTFSGCSSLESVEIPAGVTETGNQVFYNCSSLKEITLPEGLKTMGTSVFYGCTSLTGIVMPDSLEAIADTTFRNCSNLEWIVIGTGTTSVGSGAFRDCSSLKTVYYRGTETQWGTIDINSTSSYNSYLENAARYYYSESAPTDSGNWWYWDEDGMPVVW